jgi:hypothetical protein
MGVLRCVDGSVLSVEAVTCRDRIGQPYEITLKLARDSVPFAAVGQRCGYQLSDLAVRVSAARQDPEQAAAWPDPDDRFPFPEPSGAAGPESRGGHRPGGAHAGGAGHAAGAFPGDHEYFALRSHERFDLPETGELRCVLRSSAVWIGECVGVGAHSQTGRGRQRGRPAGPGQQGGPGQQSWSGQQGESLQPAMPGQPTVPGQRAVAEQATGKAAGKSATEAAAEAPAPPEEEPAVRQPLERGEQAAMEQHSHRTWRQRPGGQGRWQLTRRAVIEAWGAGGVGVRAVLTSAELVAFLDTVLNGPDGAVATGDIPVEDPHAGSHLPDRSRVA